MDIPNKEALMQLKRFVTLVKSYPDLLHLPELSFFREFIETFGGKIPPQSTKSFPQPHPEAETKSDEAKSEEKPTPPTPEPEPESEESDIELDNSGIIETPDSLPKPLKDYDPEFEVTEENIEKSNTMRVEAISAFQEGEFEKSYQLYSEAIDANPNMALLYAKRGQCNLKLNKPNACIQDCSRALLINPDCAPAYKFRGRAHRLLGHWEDAAKDLRDACKIDFDEQADEWLREVTPNARKLNEHRRKYERKHAEKELQERTERVKRAREEHAKAAAAAAASCDCEKEENIDDDDPLASSSFFSLLSDPELKSAFMDPEVMKAFEDVASDPAGGILKYQDNPKINAVIEKVKKKFPFSTPPASSPQSNDGPADVDLD